MGEVDHPHQAKHDGKTGGGKKRYYIHSDAEALQLNARLGTDLEPGQFTPWEVAA